MDTAIPLFSELEQIWRSDPHSPRLEILAADLAARLAGESAPRLVARRSYRAARELLGLRPLLNGYGLDLLGRNCSNDRVFVLIDHRYQPAPTPPAIVRRRSPNGTPRPLIVFSPGPPEKTSEHTPVPVDHPEAAHRGPEPSNTPLNDAAADEYITPPARTDLPAKQPGDGDPITDAPPGKSHHWQPASATLSIVWRRLLGAPRPG